jgi:hypothetical protein
MAWLGTLAQLDFGHPDLIVLGFIAKAVGVELAVLVACAEIT